jgi:hypothetical protein
MLTRLGDRGAVRIALLLIVALAGCSAADPEPVAQPVSAEEPEPEPEPTEVEVPDLRGLTFEDARQLARDLGLEVHPYLGGESRIGYAQRDWIIQSQMPRPGLKLAPGAEIRLNIEQEPEPAEAEPEPEPVATDKPDAMPRPMFLRVAIFDDTASGAPAELEVWIRGTGSWYPDLRFGGDVLEKAGPFAGGRTEADLVIYPTGRSGTEISVPIEITSELIETSVRDMVTISISDGQVTATGTPVPGFEVTARW